MKILHEMIAQQEELPLCAVLHSLQGTDLHWHEMQEYLLVLEGSVHVRIGETAFTMHKGDVVLIHSCLVHSTASDSADNLLLALQIDPAFFNAMGAGNAGADPQINSALDPAPAQARYDHLRDLLARIVREMAEQQPGYRMRIGKLLYQTAEHAQLHFEGGGAKGLQASVDSVDYQRLRRIVDHVRRNLGSKLTLSDLCQEEHLSYHYLSHFIKDKLGLSFQQYLNDERLEHARRLLRSTDASVTQLAGQVGFSSAAAFSRAFRQRYGESPLAFRKRGAPRAGGIGTGGQATPPASKAKPSYLDVNRTDMLRPLYAYILKDRPAPARPASTQEQILVQADQDGAPLGNMITHTMAYTHAAEGLYGHWQRQLDQLQREVGFGYARFHGLFSDRMMVTARSPLDGTLQFHWDYVDALLDKLLSSGLRPFMELGFMPGALASGPALPLMWWGANTTLPLDIAEWTLLVQSFLRHVIARYGLDEVRQWYFEVWNEPELPTFWFGSPQDYYEFYIQTAGAVKAVSPLLRVGGPAIAHQELSDSTFLQDFIAYCRARQLLPDFISLHIYPEYYPRTAQDVQQYRQLIADDSRSVIERMASISHKRRIYYQRNHTADTLRSARQKIEAAAGQPLPLHVTEWSASASHGNLIHDTAFVAAFVVHTLIQCQGLADSIAYWSFTDINEEVFMPAPPFHGGFGLINRNGIPKAAYHAYRMLARLGDTILERGDGWIVTRRGGAVQVLACNYAYYSDRFIQGDTALLSLTDRYQVFEQKGDRIIDLTLTGLSGRYRITRSCLGRQNGSAYDEWVKMGAPQTLMPGDVAHLRGVSRPRVRVDDRVLDGSYTASLTLPAHAVELIELVPITD